jgi:hypothetical protein
LQERTLGRAHPKARNRFRAPTTPRNIPRLKQRIRGLDTAAATRRAGAIMDLSDSGRIAALFDDFNTVA